MGMVVRVLLPISHALHERNFIASGLVRMLENHGHEISIFRPTPHFQGLRAFLRLGSLVAWEPTSRTCKFKLAQPRSPVHRTQITLWRAIQRLVDPEVIAARLEALLPPSKSVQATLACRPDLVLLPTMIHMDAWDNDLVKAAHRAAIPVLAAPASWDTLSSKGGFLVRPDGLLVWGEASKRHAQDYHGFFPDRITVTGPPQFDFYHEPRKQPVEHHVLMAGTSIHYLSNEQDIVKRLRDRIDNVLYRPHPRRGGDWSWSAMETLRLQLDTAVCVVTAFSTVIIEAALMGKPSLLIGFGQSSHGPAMAGYHYQLEHMAEITTWPGVILCQTQQDLVGWVKAALNGAFANKADELRRRAQEVARCDGHAQERIVAALDAR